MKIKRCEKKLVSCLLLACLFIGAAVYGAVGSGIAVTNHFQTGSVDLELKTYRKSADGIQEAASGRNITANQKLSYIPRITALRADCYVRLNVHIAMEKKCVEPVTIESVEPLENWVKKGSQLYYTKPLKTGESVNAFEWIHIPETWNVKTASGFQVNLTADAIQAAHFTPDFQSDIPWGSIKIEEAKEKDKTNYRSVKKADQTHRLIYQGDGTFELSSEDLFENFQTAVAGDAFEDSLKLINHGKNKIRLSFKCESRSEETLLEAVSVNLRIGDRHVYKGPLSAKKISNYQVLATIAPKQEKILRYELTVPIKLQNLFSVEKEKLIWYFQAEEMDEDGLAVQTGDDSLFGLSAALIAGAAATVLLLLFKKRKVK